MKRCFIVDSTIGNVSLPKHCYILPVLIQIENESFTDDKNFNMDLLLEVFEQKKKISTSQPNIGNTEMILSSLKDQYDEFVFILAGSSFSGTYQSTVMVAQQLDLNFIAIDSYGAGPHIQFLLKKAVELSEKDIDLTEMDIILSALGKGSKALIIPGSLERLKLSGRISNSQYLLGELLKICPIFYLENGTLSVLDKKRTFNKALQYMIETFSDIYPQCKSSSIVHFDFDQLNKIKQQFPDSDLFPLHASLSVHFGRGTIGFLWND